MLTLWNAHPVYLKLDSYTTKPCHVYSTQNTLHGLFNKQHLKMNRAYMCYFNTELKTIWCTNSPFVHMIAKATETFFPTIVWFQCKRNHIVLHGYTVHQWDQTFSSPTNALVEFIKTRLKLGRLLQHVSVYKETIITEPVSA